MTDHWRSCPGKYLDDPTAVDGKRFISSTQGWRMVRELLAIQAGNRCENCNEYRVKGDTHHIYGRGSGGGKREDRISVSGVRFLRFLCRACHDRTPIQPWGSWKQESVSA